MDTYGVFEKIRRFAEVSAEQLANRHRGDPVAELDAWLLLGAEREHMARRVYNPGLLEKRLEALTRNSVNGEMIDVIQSAIECIWTHEESHTAYLDAIGRVSDTIPQWAAFFSDIKGLVVANNSLPDSPRQDFSEILLRVVVPLGAPVPDFVLMMKELTLRDFCRFNSALEDTAVGAYSRILELHLEIEASGKSLSVGFNRQIKLFILDEQCHREIFRTIADDWLIGDDQVRNGLAPKQALLQLKEILEGTNQLPNAGRIHSDSEPVYAAQELGMSMLFTDAGLKPLFERFDVDLPTMSQDLALELIEPPRLLGEDI